jgi:hypothetical protein
VYAVDAGVDCDRGDVGPSNDALVIEYEQRSLANAFGRVVHAICPGHFPFRFEIGKQREM